MAEKISPLPRELGLSLGDRLDHWAEDDADKTALRTTITAMAAAAREISRLISFGPLSASLSAEQVGANQDGDPQKSLDLLSNRLILAALAGAPVAYVASKEEDAILTFQPGGLLAVAVDPLDGSSNIDVNVSIGTIFSIFPRAMAGASASFLRPAAEQVAAGYFIYGSHSAFLLTVGEGVDLYVLDPDSDQFRLARANLRIPAEGFEFAINASNYRHWTAPVRTYIEDCLEGTEGPYGQNFNMRWIASLVAETHRIFARGGVFLYPADRRSGYERGRLRMVYQAAPIALLAEQAGGGASDGLMRLLDKAAAELQEQTPLIFGSARNVAAITAYHLNSTLAREHSPLFRRRGLFS
jgi:fructose-1,6-bisphosphatase I